MKPRINILTYRQKEAEYIAEKRKEALRFMLARGIFQVKALIRRKS